MPDYFAHPFCSNSGLTKLGRTLGIFPEIDIDTYNAYRLGSLFDAVVTEPEKIDLIQNRIFDTDYTFTPVEYENSRLMYKALQEDKLYQDFIRCQPELQKELYQPSFQFEYEGFSFALDVKAKLDFFVPGIVSDLKSTFAATKKQFESAFVQFSYPRQMVLYCRLTCTKKAIVFGVSKVNRKVFLITMQEGDRLWKIGERELNYLAFKYYMTK
ncbi:MAG: hypothetical protein BGO31_00065 [Bacteroidetes bacterium 43-16]|uniref:PD-(D/E)XK nuclease-like domain-containing protein n=1 Tax=uncultured Dysgonomonas sp. TaxID=206096 RepID=UPI00092766EC|nr:PD-(D/E)XK nuclease-like domain-containing protein [uncultured Dysgonomonas sp.]OJV51633.1 MAG: hypothetical protein BGO31_00065 [Bacteroidetes bacterium 43-16]